MLKELSKSIREFKAASVKAPVFVSLEVVLVSSPLSLRSLSMRLRRGADWELLQATELF